MLSRRAATCEMATFGGDDDGTSIMSPLAVTGTFGGARLEWRSRGLLVTALIASAVATAFHFPLSL